mgnify:CR=1 FL=1
MKRRKTREWFDKAISLARKLAKVVDKADRTHRKLVHLRTEVRPADRTYIPAHTRKLVFIRDNHRCVKCGSTKNLEIHHIVPHARGGSNRLENLQLLCQRCNRMKGVD